MFKSKAVAFILITSFILTANAFCQQADKNQKENTITGTVTFVDVAGSIVSVKTNTKTMVFDITVESKLFRFAHHMASIEIEKGDPVTIQYSSTILGKNIISKLVDQKPESF